MGSKQFKERKRSWAVERKTGQTSLEFLFSAGLALFVFSIAMLLFIQSQSDAAAMGAYTESKLICQQVSATISAVASAGDGAASRLELFTVSGGRSYLVFVSAANKTVSVSYSGAGVGCRLTTGNISNGSSGSFYVG